MSAPRPPAPLSRATLTLALGALAVACSGGGGARTPSPAAPPALASLALAPDPLHLTMGESVQLTVTGTDTAGQTADLTAVAILTADPAGVVSIDGGGLVSALVEGATTVTARATAGGATRSASLRVTVTGAGGYDPGPGWTLVWSDEFSGTQLDPASWTFDLGSGGWGNGESQWYRAENAEVADGLLTITARQESFGDAPYTSARIQTSRKRTFTHGKFAMRARLPSGQGLWPAFWLLGANSSAFGLYGGDTAWPGCGEIDAMEMIGGLADGSGDFTAHGTLHYLDAGGRNPAPSFARRLPQRLSDDFHLYELVWTPQAFTWKLDGVAYGTQVVTADMEELRKPFFILLNLAVGGAWGGWPDASTVFPQQFVIDWVRAYDGPATQPAAPGLATTWHLSNAAASGVGLSAETLTSTAGTVSGFQPTRSLAAPATWSGPALTGRYDEGAWSVGLMTTPPGAAATVRAEVLVTAADGSAPRSLGAAEVDVNATGGGNHMSWFRLAGVPAQTLSAERLKLVVTQLGGPTVTLVYNGNDFDSRLTTPWSAASP
jgi:beta-glucanase (GH16 family)